MIRFWIGAMIGCMVGISTMCFCVVAAEEDRWLEKHENRCKFCGGKLSEIRTFGDKKVRHCYSCHFDYEVEE